MAIYKTNKILENGRGTTPVISGEITKIAVKTSNHMPELRILIISNEDELMHDSSMRKKHDVFYPYNNLDDDADFKPLFHIEGQISFKVEGLAEGESIEYIAFYYKSPNI